MSNNIYDIVESIDIRASKQRVLAGLPTNEDGTVTSYEVHERGDVTRVIATQTDIYSPEFHDEYQESLRNFLVSLKDACES
jgi:hypothetical protein